MSVSRAHLYIRKIKKKDETCINTSNLQIPPSNPLQATPCRSWQLDICLTRTKISPSSLHSADTLVCSKPTSSLEPCRLHSSSHPGPHPRRRHRPCKFYYRRFPRATTPQLRNCTSETETPNSLPTLNSPF